MPKIMKNGIEYGGGGGDEFQPGEKFYLHKSGSYAASDLISAQLYNYNNVTYVMLYIPLPKIISSNVSKAEIRNEYDATQKYYIGSDEGIELIGDGNSVTFTSVDGSALGSRTLRVFGTLTNYRSSIPQHPSLKRSYIYLVRPFSGNVNTGIYVDFS